MMAPSVTIFALAALPAVLALESANGVGKLPALGWNSWVSCSRMYLHSYVTDLT